jgi:hypothetical protein
MRRRLPHPIEMSPADRRQLESLLCDGRTEQRVARRARILLAMTDPDTIVKNLAEQVAQTRIAIWYLCHRYEAMGIEAIFDAPRSGRQWEISPWAQVEIEQLACCDPAGIGLHITHWSTRSLAQIAVERGIVPRIQVLERCQPTRLVRPGQIERREFEYIRHGTVKFLVALIVHSGKMRGWCLPANDSYELCRVLPSSFTSTARPCTLK